MDDVLEELVEEWIKQLNITYGKHVKFSDVTRWDFSNTFGDLTPKELYSPFKDGTIWERLSPTEGSEECLSKLKDDGHEIYVVTASHYSEIRPKIKWLLREFPFVFSWDHVIIANKKSMIKGDVIIDDAIHNLTDPDIVKIVYDKPWNRIPDDKELGLIRAYTWEDIYRIVTTLQKEKMNASK